MNELKHEMRYNRFIICLALLALAQSEWQAVAIGFTLFLSILELALNNKKHDKE